MKRYFILISMLIIGVLSSYAQQTSAFTWATGTTTFQPSASTLKLNGVAFKDNQNGVIVGSDGKVYRTTNGGSSWIAITNPVASLPGGGWFGRPEFRDITYIGNNSYFAVASAGKVMKSTNGGESWDTITITPQPTTNNYMSVAYNNGIVFIGGEAGKLFKGTNNGQNWTQINDSDFGAITFNDICVVDNNTMYIAGSVGRVFKSTDGGESWSVIRPSESLTNQFLNIAFKDANNGIVVGASGKVFKTNNGGNTWTQVENVFGATDIDGVIYKGNTIIVVGQGGQAWSSIDNGVTWQANNRIGYFARFSDLAFLNNNTAFAVGMSGGAFRLENITINNSPSNPEPPNPTPTPNTPIVENTTGAWTSLVANLPAGEANTSHYALAFSSPQVGVIVSAAGKVFRTTNGGDQWINVTNPIGQIADNPPDIYTVNCDEQGVYYAGGGNGNAMKSTNNGTMWESMTIANGLTQGVMRIATRNGVVLVSAGTTKYRSDDNGVTWGIIQDGALGSSSLYQIYFATNEIVYAVSTMGNIFKSNNAGLSWSSSRGNINTTTTFNSVAFKDAMNGIVVGRAGNAYITDDGGTSWTRIQNVFGNTVLNAVAYKGDYIVVMGAGGNAWISYDNGANWTQSNPSGAYSGDFKDVRFIDNNKAIAVGFSGGVYKLTITPAAPITPTIAATPNAVNFTANPAGTQQVTVTSNSAWTVSENIEWLTVTPTSGSNNGTLTLTATANTGAQRSGIVTLQAGTATQTINVTQAASAVTPPPAPNLDELAWTTINSTNFIPAPPGAISEPSLRAIGWATEELGFAGGDGGRLYKTTDGGDTWNVVQYNTNEGNNPAIYDIYFVNATEGYAALGGGHVMSTNDGGTTWTRRSSGVTTDDLYTVVKVGNAVFFGGYAGRVIKSTDNGITFENVTAPTGGMDVRSSYVITNTIFLCGQDGMVIKSTDGGLQWSSSRNGITDNFDDLMSIHFRDASEGYIVGQYGAHYKTTDGGANWSTFTLPESGTTNSYTLNGIDFNGQRGIIVGANGKAWTTENGGDTWTYGKPNVDQSNTLHAVAFSSENNAVAVGYDQSIYRYSQSTTLATTLTVNPTEVNFAAVATGSQQVTVTSNSAWTVSENIEWLTVTPMAGNNNGTLTLTATANTLAQARTGIVTVTAGTGANAVTQTITVTQAGTTTSVPTEYTWTAQTVQNIGTNSLYGLSRIDAMNAYAVGTNKTIIKTVDGGINWTPVENNLTPGTGIYAVHFISNDVGYIAAPGAKIAKTIDYGATWSTGRVGTGTWRDVYFTNATTGYACGTSAQVAKTTNGTAWEVETVSSYGGTFMAQKVLNNGNIIAVGTSGGIYKKSNNDWGRLPAGLGTASITFRDVDFKDNNVGIVVGDGGFILRTTGGGDQWTRIQGNNVPSSLANKNLKAVCFADANTVYIGGADGYMLKSTDAGATWSEVTSGTNKTINNIAFYSDGTGIAVCDGATVLRYGSVAVIPPTPQTGAWTVIDNDDMMYPLNSIYPVDANTVFAVGMHNYDGTQTHVFKSTNQGTNWTNSAPLNDEEVQFEDVWFRNASSGFIVGTDGTVLRTSNGGTSWTSVLINGLGSTDMKAVRFPTQSTGYIAGLSGKVFKSTNSGNTWTRLTSAPSAINFVDMHFVTDDLGYLVGQGIVKTTNGGATWTTRYLTNTSSNDSLQGVYFTSAQVGYVVGNGGRAYKTVDGGTTWVPMVVSNNGDSTLYSVYFVNDNLGYVTNKRGGIFKTTNAGLTWTRENTPTTEALYKVRFLNENLGYAVGAGGTALRYTGNATPAPTLTVDPAIMQFAATAVAPLTAQQQPVTITTNNNWNATVSQGAESWLSVLPGNGTSAVGAAAVIAQNNTGAARTGTVTINAGGLTQTITVNQAGVANPPVNDDTPYWAISNTGMVQAPAGQNYDPNLNAVWFVNATKGFAGGENGRLYKTTDGGATWALVTHPYSEGYDVQNQINDIKFKDANIGYIALNNGKALRTTDGGETWNTVTTGTNSSLNTVITKGDVVVIAGASGTIIRSTNNGVGFTTLPSTAATGLGSVTIFGGDAADNNIFYLSAGSRKILKSENAGETWAMANNGTGTSYEDFRSIKFIDANNGFVVGEKCKVFKTIDGATQWTEVQDIPEADNSAYQKMIRGIDIFGNRAVMVGTEGKAWTSINNGDAWAFEKPQASFNNAINDVHFVNATTAFAVGDRQKIYKLTFGGQAPAPVTPTLAVAQDSINFEQNATATITIAVTSNTDWTVSSSANWYTVTPKGSQNNGYIYITPTANGSLEPRINTFTVTAGDITKVITIRQNGIYLAPENTPNWEVKNEGVETGNINFNTVYFINEQIGFAGGTRSRMYKTVNGGQNWTLVQHPLYTEAGGPSIMDINFKDNLIGYASFSSGGILKTIDGGASWTQVQSGVTTNLNTIAISGDMVIIGTTLGKVVKSNDNGATFNLSATIPAASNRELIGSYVFDGTIYMSGAYGRVMKSNNGNDWTAIVNGITDAYSDLYKIHFTNNQNGYVIGQKDRLFKTENAGDQWTEVTGVANTNSGNYASRLYGIDIEGNRGVLVGTNGRAWISPDNGTTWLFSKPENSFSGDIKDVQFINATTAFAVGADRKIYKVTFGTGTPTPTLAVDRNEVNFQAANATNPLDQQTTTITVTSNRAWTVTENIEWLSVNPENGTNNGTFVISVLPNTGDQRTGTVTVTAGNLTQTITVNQAAGTPAPAPTLTVNPTAIQFEEFEDAGAFTITSNTNWVITTEADWLTITPMNGNGNLEIDVQTTENTGAERTATITVTAGNIVRTVTATQAGTQAPAPTQGVWTAYDVTGGFNDVYALSPSTAVAGGGWNQNISRTTTSGDAWTTTASGSVMSIDFVDSQTGFAAGRNGNVKKTTDGGETWQNANTGITGDPFFWTIDFVNDQVGYVGGNGAIYKTTNGGAQWTPITAPANGRIYSLFFVNPEIGYAAMQNTGVYKTTNGGASWQRITSFPQVTTRALHFFDEQTGYVTYNTFTERGIKKTTDGGETWVEMQIPQIPGQVTYIGIHFPTPQVGYACGWQGGIVKTRDGGATWTRDTLLVNGQIFTGTLEGIHFADENNGYCVGDGKIFRYSAGTPPAPTPTLTVNPTAVNFNATATAAAPLTQTITVTANNPWTVTIPATATWLTATPANGTTLIPGFVLTAEPNSGAARNATVTVTAGTLTQTITVNQAAGTPAPTPTEYTWSVVQSGTARNFTRVEHVGNGIAYASADGGVIMKTVDGGRNWNYVLNTDGNNDRNYAISFPTPNTGYVAKNIGEFRKYNATTNTWNTSLVATGTNSILWQGIHFTSEQNGVIVGSNGKIYYTITGGTQWLPATLNETFTNYFRDVYFTNNQTGYAVGALGRIFKTIDGGVQWNREPSGTQTVGFNSVHFAANGTLGLAAGNNGRISRIDGNAWEQLPVTSFPESARGKNIRAIRFVNENLAFVAGEDGKLLKSTDRGLNWIEVTSGTNQYINGLSFDSNGEGIAVCSSGVILRYGPAQVAPTLTVNPTAVNFNATATTAAPLTQTVTVTSNSAWTVSENIEWLTVTPMAGNNNGTLTLTVTANTLAQARTGTVTVTAGTGANAVTQTITVNQAAGQVNPQTNWTQLTTGIADNTKNLNKIFFVSDNVGFFVGDPGVGVRKTTDGGSTWNNIARNSNLINDNVVYSVFFLDENNGYVGLSGDQLIHKTTNSGADWESVGNGTVNVNDMDFISMNYGRAVSLTNGYIYYMRDGASVFTGENLGNAVTGVRAIHAPAETYGYAIGHTNSADVIIKAVNYLDEEEGWNVRRGYTFPLNSMNDIYFINATTGFIVGNNGVIKKTNNSAESWEDVVSGTSNNLKSVHFVDSEVGYICGDSGLILRTDDGGATWNQEQSGVTTNLRSIHSATATAIYVCGENNTVLKRTPAQVPTPTLTVAPTAVEFAATATAAAPLTQTITVTANNPWTVTIPAEATWLTATPANGTTLIPGFVLTALPNTGAARNTTVTVTSGTLTQTITVTQAAPVFAVTPEQVAFAATPAGTQEVAVTSGSNWAVANNSNWLTVAPMNGTNNGTLTLTAQPNTGGVRVATFTVTEGNTVKTITVTQAGSSTLIPGWTVVNAGPAQAYTEYKAIKFRDAMNGIAVGVGHSIARTNNGGLTWTTQLIPNMGNVYGLFNLRYVGDNIQLADNQSRIYKSEDNGVNWDIIGTLQQYWFNAVYFIDAEKIIGGSVADVNVMTPIRKTTDGGISWSNPIQNAGHGNCQDFDFVTDQIGWAVGNSSTVLKTTDGGNSWIDQNPGLPVNLTPAPDWSNEGELGGIIDVDFVDEQTGYICGFDGKILKSTNGGAAWVEQNSGTQVALRGIFAINADLVYAVGDGGTILKTTNGGTTWTPEVSNTTKNLHEVYFLDANNGYAVGADRTIVKFYQPVVNPELTVAPEAHTFAALATANEPLTKTIEVTCNVDWTVTKNVEWLSVQPASGSNNGTFTITAEEHFVRNPRTGVVTVSAGGITKEITITQEAGEPLLVNGWNVITTDPNATAGGIWANQFTHISFKDDMHGFVSGPNGKVAKTVDGGKNWTISDFPVANVLFYGLSYTNTSLRLAQNNNVIRKSTDDGITWTPIGTPITDWSFLDEVVFVNDNIVIASTWGGTPGTGPQRVKRSSNGGLSWDTVHTNGFAEVLKFDFVNDRTGWGVGYKGTVVKTTDAGRTWTEQATPLPRNTTNDHISCLMGVDFVDANIGYAAGHGGKIIKTTNGGQTWIELNSGSDKYLYDIKAYNADIVLAVGAEGTILRSLDGGNSWNLEPSQTTEDLQEVYFLDDKNAVAVGNKRTILRYKNIFTPMMNVDPAVVTLEKDKDSEKTINVTANQAWTVADDAAWLDLDVTNNANNNGTVKVIANSANNTVENRVATVTFTMNQVVKTVTVTQKPSVSYLTINYATKEVPSAGEAFAIEITSNDAWTITDDAEWVTVNPATGNNNANITVTVAENAIAIAREATVTFTTANNATKTLKITQVAAGANLVLSTDKLQVDANSSSNAVTITSNVVWTASVDATYDWISVLPANGMGNGAINVVVNANTATTNREGVVTVSGGGMTKTIQVKQSRFIPEAKNWTIIPTTVDNDFTSVMMPSQNTAYITGWSIYQGTSNEPAKVLKTTNNGDTWTNYTPDPTMLGGFGFNTVYFTDNQTGHVAGFSSKYGKTEQGAADWNVREIAPQSYQEWGNVFYSVDFINSNIGMMVGLNWNVYKTDNGGATWVLKDGDSARPALRCVDFVTDQVAYVVGDKKTIRKTTDGGNTWATQSFENTDTAPTLHGVHFINERVGHVVGFKGTYGKTTDGGQTWTWTNGLNGYNNLLLYSVKFVNATKGYIVGAEGKIFKTTDGGANWVEEASGTDKTLMSIYFYDENNGFIVGKKSTILKYTPDAEIAVTPTEFNAPAAGKEQVITVTSSGEYTVTTDAEWIVPSANRGIGNGTITLTVTKNETIEPRVGVVKFQIGNIIRNVVVSQEPTVPTLTVSQSLVALGAIERRKQTITVTSNIDWTVEDIKVSWIKVNPVKGGGKVIKFDIEADANMLEQSRATSIRVVAGNLSKNIYVSQSGYSAESQILTITPAEVVMTDAAGSAELKVTSNQKWTVQEDDEWLSLNVNKGENNGTVKLTVTENKSSEDRTAIIVFKSDNLVESVKVIQKGKQIETIFEVTPAEITLAYTQGSEADITIKANKAWTASDDAEWLTLSADKGNNDGTIKVTANENTASEDRIATVTLKSGEITKTVKVTQKAYEVFVTINPESLEFTHEKGSKEVTIESNTKWTLTTTNEWITFTKSEGENNGNFNVEVSENNSTQERNGVITVSYGEGKTKTIKVKQAANPSSVAMANDETLVYPNPTEDVLFIKHAETIKSVKVIDARGKVVLSINQLSVNSVHMKDLTAGTYTIVIEDIHGNKLTKKISKL